MKEIAQKWKSWLFCIPQSQKSLRDFSGFPRFPSRNLAQTNAFTNISLDMIILTLEKPKGAKFSKCSLFRKKWNSCSKITFPIYCSKTAFWAPMAPTPYKRNGILALFGAILPRKLEMCKFMHFNDFCDFLRFSAFLGPKVENVQKVQFWDQKNPHEPLCFACFLSQRHHLRCLDPLFPISPSFS